MAYKFNGLGMNMGNLSRLSTAETRSISAENRTGAKGKGGMATEGTGANAARELGQTWKVNPCLTLPKRSLTTLAEIKASGAIQHIWITVHPKVWRSIVLRMYWDGEKDPSVEVPLGDFFCMGWGERANVNSLAVAVNPAGGFNCYWEMPFTQKAVITVENLLDEEIGGFFFQIDYTLTDVPEDAGRFHAQFRRNNPLPYGEVHTLLDGVKGFGQYVGTYMAWGSNNNGWWGEGEIKFFMDGDEEFPTICGTGTEDYFCGAWCFEFPQGQYGVYTGNYAGMPQVIGGDGVFRSQQRFGLYRWHILDPIRFKTDLKVTMQALGWRSGGRYLLLQDDIASTSFWYQTEPHAPFPEFPSKDDLEVI
ncbi:MAG: glycoside hydrolase family 172 protein [Anaerolineae bacterium]|jgi:hypothetical protein|nr:glycoside hydrolase family 172 protein [Anaerolineae bacterium]